MYKSTCTSIFDSLQTLRDRLVSHTSFSPEVIEDIYRQLRSEVRGPHSFVDVVGVVSKETIKERCFPQYQEKSKVRGYQVTRCIDPQVASLIYPRFLAAHDRYPNNDQIPLYFAQQVFVEVHCQMKPNYPNIPGYYGQGRGRIADRDAYHRRDRAPPRHKDLVGQRFPTVVPAVTPIADHVVIASQREAIDRIGKIASVAATISSDRVGKYMMSRPRSRSSIDHASSSHGGASDSDDRYISAGIPSPDEVAAIVGGSRHVQMSQYLAEDLLHAYSFISSRLGIPLADVREAILRDGQATAASMHTSR
ncbi:uncharacterized protein LOC131054334 [Cryptomeria japonica]|uniref:uncharacterized protein LOC131054334 n=1 Tax=Cryptomeria japonica TaxID=3369 RepID=UPI0027DA124E|nr:uncharacterized protein LOC131054334 [Cryptomeria japonica]